MNLLQKKIESIQGIWKQLTLFGTWIASVTGSFFLPLPEWGVEDENTSQMHFIFFMATVIAGFILILTFRLRNGKIWLSISVISLLLLITFFYSYSWKRSASTLPYYETTVVIGNEYKVGIEERREALGTDIDDETLLKFVAGKTNIIWTRESISRNRWTLISLLTLSYCIASVFIISFVNTIIIYISNEE
ncbi:hypothetical protein A8B79_04325 [Balneola sp. EhC07]|uniref:hypothetical protein n=1 Tax=Balneola sp. EhC07 TaxID=1849360 RepID=UPI0007F50D59|nr:hypothetical protein [Balneola sp. EhC07]OAN61659.1 hypothetical protein A8B79_04325 [Balneola sp. EhC07]